MKKLLFAMVMMLSLVGIAIPIKAQWNLYEETSIAGTVSGSIRKGHIFKTRSGHIYEVDDYVYLYEYEYSPDVIVLSEGSRYKLIIEGFDEPLVCKCLNCNQTSVFATEVVESYIISNFDGFNYGNIYKLANGQIWEQIDYWIWLWMWVYPKVIIWNDGGIYRMKVECIDHPVAVRRIK